MTRREPRSSERRVVSSSPVGALIDESQLDRFEAQRTRLGKASVAMGLTFVVGTLGYWLLGRGEVSLLDAAYMTVITLSTVGYKEVIPVGHDASLQVFTMMLLFVGMGTILYFVSAMAAFIIEGDLFHALWRRRLESRIASLKGHTIVCGVGRSGAIAVSELLELGREVVGIDPSWDALQRLGHQPGEGFFPMHGDATEDQVLETAGVHLAAGLVAATGDERDNLYITFTARQLNPRLRIVAKSLGPEGTKLARAGADAVVAINDIGGHRMVSELIRPRATGFVTELMLGKSGHGIEEMIVAEGAALQGHLLGEADLRRECPNLLIVAARAPGQESFTYAPGPQLQLLAGTSLIAMGTQRDVARFAELVGA